MAKEWAKSFYNSKAWQRCRASYIAERVRIDGGVCEECQQEQGYIVHHRIILTAETISNPEIALNHKYMEYVCKACHDKFEGHGVNGRGKVKPLCLFDENGQPISLREIDTPPFRTSHD
ncbi:MAG: hypothetical protein J6B68_04025 [Lachnospiraceae bacterium]|nr:hypothetical protein [Lachnospiraceae bacterium]